MLRARIRTLAGKSAKCLSEIGNGSLDGRLRAAWIRNLGVSEWVTVGCGTVGRAIEPVETWWGQSGFSPNYST